MKYLKTYENLKEEKKYWIIPIEEPFFSAGIYKLYNMYSYIDDMEPFSYIEKILINNDLITAIRPGRRKYQKTVIIDFQIPKDSTYWGWGDDEKWQREHGYKYMGELEITNEDIENYNIFKEIEKYNL